MWSCFGRPRASSRGRAAWEIGLELRAEELRRAGEFVWTIAGTIGAEDVLGAIFSEFCIGK